MADFSKGKIYKIWNDANDKIYVGSTTQVLSKRFACHITGSKIETKKHRPLYADMCKIGSDQFHIELIQNYECDSKNELNAREGFYIRELRSNKPDLGYNKNLAGRTKSDSQKQYYDLHKKYYENYHKKYYLIKYNCECGANNISWNNKTHHEMTNKHNNSFMVSIKRDHQFEMFSLEHDIKLIDEMSKSFKLVRY